MTEGLPAEYRVPAGAYDEMLDADGQTRPVWQALLDSSDFGSSEALEARWHTAERLIRENGVTYNVYGDPRGLARPWPLDPVPMILSAEDWRIIETGVIQRAQLLNALIADIYGPQDSLREGLLPPGAIFGNPGFLRPCHGVDPPDGIHLHLAAIDIARRPDGGWVALGDRTQTPSGAGYALENRMVLSRSVPDAFRGQPVERLTGFFTTLKESLGRAATAAARRSRGSVSEPRIVLLTPGPYNEVYFEHAYLARNLGYPLVAGEDLTVRYDRVYLKTLGGLQPVDGILRRLDDDYCDPLWLKSVSSLGIPGLLGAARRGYVAICNQLGSGVVEAPALQPYLSALSRHLLGQELILPQAETHWFGDPEIGVDPDLLKGVVIKPAFPGLKMEPVFGDRLDAEAREALLEKIVRRPGAFVAQQHVRLSCVPSWQDETLTPRPMVLRTFVSAANGSYVLMPGGLTRIAQHLGDPVVSMQWGGGSKDTWIVSSEPVEAASLRIVASEPLELRRTGSDLPSRVADNLFWLGRYAERAEFSMRLTRALLNRSVSDQGSASTAAIPYLLDALDELGVNPPAAPGIAALIDACEGPIRQHLELLHRTATAVRDRLSLDTWRVLNPLATAPVGTRNAGSAVARLDHLISRLAALNGLIMENMTRGLGWRFLEIGRRLERSYLTLSAARILGDATAADESPALDALLEVCDSSMTYRSRYITGMRPAAVLDLAIIDDTNPRSVSFQFSAIVEHVRHLPRERHGGGQPTAEHRLSAAMLSAVRRADATRLAMAPPAGSPARPVLDEFCMGLIQDLSTLSNAVNEAYFKHAIIAPIAPSTIVPPGHTAQGKARGNN